MPNYPKDSNSTMPLNGGSDEVFTPDKVPQGEPQEAHPYTEDFSDDANLVSRILDVTQTHFSQYQADRSDMEDKWERSDYMWKCGIDAAKRKQNERDATTGLKKTPTEADTGSTLFWRQVTRLTAQTLSVLFAKEDPYQYVPMFSKGAFLKQDEGESMANQQNALGRWTRKQDGFDVKMIEGVTSLNKYENIPACLYWKYRTGNRKEKRVIRGNATAPNEAAPVIGFEFVNESRVVDNYPTLKFLRNDQLYADRHIGNLQDQNCIIINSQVNYASLYDGQRDGYYHNVEKVTSDHLYKGETTNTGHADRQVNAGLSSGDDTQTGLFDQWDVLVRVPVSDDGKWDAKKNEPLLYWLTFVGDLQATPLCIRCVRNPDPDDEIPVLMWHQFPDDSDQLYHVGAATVIEPNFEELTTAKNQAIDNRDLQNKKPLTVVRGEVYTKNLTFRRDKVFEVEKQDSLREAQVSDNTNTILANINYLDEDANRALSTDQAIEGRPMGGRTSASEAVNVYNQAKMPHLITARYQLSQFLTWYGRKTQRLWNLYALPEQVVELTGEPQYTEIKPFTLYGDYEVLVDAVDQVESDSTKLNAINFAFTQLMANPVFAQSIIPSEALKEWAELNGWKNPKFIKDRQSYDADRWARIEQDIMLNELRYVPPQPDEDTEAHLRVHKSYLLQFKNIDGAHEKFPGLVLIEQHVAETEMLQARAQQMQQMAASPMGGSQPAPSGNFTPGMEAGNQMAAQLGAIQ